MHTARDGIGQWENQVMESSEQPKTPAKNLDLRFLVVLGASFFLTLLSAACSTLIALQATPDTSADALALVSNFMLMFSFGMGTITGLLAGRHA